jgi:hypothetical protein
MRYTSMARKTNPNPLDNSDTAEKVLSFRDESSNEQLLFVINRETGLAPYSHEFVLGAQDPQILAGFVSAMTSFMGEVTGQTLSDWKTVYGADTVLLVEVGDWASGVMAVSRETTEVRSKLRRVLLEFEDTFQYLRDADGFEGSAFKEFDHFVRRVFLADRLSDQTMILKPRNWQIQHEKYELPSVAYRIASLIHNSKNEQTLRNIAEEQGLEVSEARDIVSRAVWNSNLEVVYAPSDNDILSMAEKADSYLFAKGNHLALSPTLIQIAANLDGRRTFGELVADIDREEAESVRGEIALLISRGYVQHIPLEHLLVLVNESILSHLLETCISGVGLADALRYYQKAFAEVVEGYPWVARISLGMNNSPGIDLDGSMNPSTLEEICDAIEVLYQTLGKVLSKSIGEENVSEAVSLAKKQAHSRWESYLQDFLV